MHDEHATYGANDELDLIEFAQNPDPRAPCLLLLDTSGSMAGAKIAGLSEGLALFKQELMADALARRRVEVGVVTFGGGPSVAQDFVTVENWRPAPLRAGGATPLGGALGLGLELVAKRKERLKRGGLDYYRPWVFLITDGEPTDDVAEAARAARQADADGKLIFFAVGVDGANMERLAAIAPPGRPPLKLRGLHFAELFLWLSRSQQQVSHSRVGDQLALPPVGWADIST